MEVNDNRCGHGLSGHRLKGVSDVFLALLKKVCKKVFCFPLVCFSASDWTIAGSDPRAQPRPLIPNCSRGAQLPSHLYVCVGLRRESVVGCAKPRAFQCICTCVSANGEKRHLFLSSEDQVLMFVS